VPRLLIAAVGTAALAGPAGAVTGSMRTPTLVKPTPIAIASAVAAASVAATSAVMLNGLGPGMAGRAVNSRLALLLAGMPNDAGSSTSASPLLRTVVSSKVDCCTEMEMGDESGVLDKAAGLLV
jgi:hypothetical protein